MSSPVSSLTAIKFSFDSETRRVKVRDYPHLVELVHSAVPLKGDEELLLRYEDEEGEWIDLKGDDAYHAWIECFQARQKIPKLQINKKIKRTSAVRLNIISDQLTDSPTASNSSSAPPTPPSRPSIDAGFACSGGCGASPIIGVRYHCPICPRVDLCEQCERMVGHRSDHPLIKFRSVRPAQQSPGQSIFNASLAERLNTDNDDWRRHSTSSVSSASSASESESEPDSPSPSLRSHPHRGAPASVQAQPVIASSHHACALSRVMKGFGRFLGLPEYKSESSSHPPAKSWRKCSHHWSWRSKTDSNTEASEPHTPLSTAETVTSSVTSTREPSLKAIHVRDVSIPHRSIVQPGAILIKTWLVQNSGNTEWPHGTKLCLIKNQQLSSAQEFSVPVAKPGQSVELHALLRVPNEPGRYQATFRLADKMKKPFGQRFWADVIVAEKSASEADDQAAHAVSAPAAADSLEGQAEPGTARLEDQLAVLASLGFRNEQRNRLLIAEKKGNMQDVVEFLVRFPEIPAQAAQPAW